MLNLFVQLRYRFSNLVVGAMTRESVRRALSNGISAAQIISYLTSHAHPLMASKVLFIFWCGNGGDAVVLLDFD